MALSASSDGPGAQDVGADALAGTLDALPAGRLTSALAGHFAALRFGGKRNPRHEGPVGSPRRRPVPRCSSCSAGRLVTPSSENYLWFNAGAHGAGVPDDIWPKLGPTIEDGATFAARLYALSWTMRHSTDEQADRRHLR